MLLRAFLLIFLSILLAVSEAGRVPTKAAAKASKNAKKNTRSKTNTAAASGRKKNSKATSNKKQTPVVDAKKFTTDPHSNPHAKDPTKPTGHKDNPAAVHYNPKTQGDQTEIIKHNPSLGKPVKLDTAPNRKKPADIRRGRYREHEPAKPGKSKEDQLPASFGDKPGNLYNVEPSEQRHQAVAVNRANTAARKGDAHVQQVIYSGSNGNPPDRIPKKSKTRRDLLLRSLLARALEESDFFENSVYMSRRAIPELYVCF